MMDAASGTEDKKTILSIIKEFVTYCGKQNIRGGRKGEGNLIQHGSKIL